MEQKMPPINPYIVFNGNAEEAFNFYKSVFGGDFSKVKRFSEMSSPKSMIEKMI
jgi:PhnB protein